ncbi:UDP-glycosyltransferase 86A2 [Neltuma alba]|uniref:UDP-glycosyltransferase 86A2 n=1 Tax=Neltuma alba TaxID=207710 RepID=UPI0010A30C2B|nr:UDP-glycosyltransferase 86A2 [Prosopis alba]
MGFPNSPEQHPPHAILFAYPTLGHVIPSVHLAIKLASCGFVITFVNTHSIHHHTSRAASDSSHPKDDIFAAVRDSGLDIRYTTVSDGLPVGFDHSLHHEQFMQSMLHVFSAHVEELVAKLVKQSVPPVTCLIADTFFVWPSMIAKKFGLLYVSFWTEPALVFSLYYHMNLLRKNGHFACQDARDDSIDYIPGVEAIHPKDMMSYLQEKDTSTVCHQIIFNAFKEVRGADFVLCNTVQELEPHTISALQAHVPFFAVGPIFPLGFTKSTVPTSLWSESDCTQWLDSKPRASVLYISFGSTVHVAKRDLLEIANGLLLTHVNFLWVLRPDVVSSEDQHPLPIGFEEAIHGRGMIIPWCSQIEVLTHSAIGGFLTHCGWNSILESIWSEVPLLCFPLLTDQFTNRKLVVDDWKIGINLGNACGLVKKEEVSQNVNRLMDEKMGAEFKSAVRDMKKTLRHALMTNGSSKKNMECFVRDLKTKVSTSHARSTSNGHSVIDSTLKQASWNLFFS